MLIFKSKIDSWVYILFGVLVLACLFACIKSIQSQNVISYVSGLATLVLGVGVPLWLMSSTQYLVNRDTLFIQSGPGKWSVPLASITAVQETRSLLSSPALSLDRLEISYAENKKIIVSPEQKEAFRKAIGFPK